MTAAAPTPLLLHVGCGDQRLDGWVNIDRQELPAVDLVADVTAGLPFDDAEALFAEHFLEHLPLDQALAFLSEAHRVLGAGGRLRLSTPNLDWVLAGQYPRPGAEDGAAALQLNRSFYGWSHRFLWNRPLLADALAAVGFSELRWYRHGESDWPPFRNLERHETYQDTPDLPHVLIVEARKGAPQSDRLAAFRAAIRDGFLRDVRPLGWAVDPARSSVVAHLPVAGVLGLLVRRHVLRAGWVGGSVHIYPEAPEESRAIVDVVAHQLVADEPALRRRCRLPRLPHALRRRIDAKLRGPGYLDADRWPLIRFETRSIARRDGGRRVMASGDLELRGRAVPLDVEAETTLEGESWRARGQLTLSTEALKLPPWRLRQLLRETGELRVEFDIVATAVSPT